MAQSRATKIRIKKARANLLQYYREAVAKGLKCQSVEGLVGLVGAAAQTIRRRNRELHASGAIRVEVNGPHRRVWIGDKCTGWSRTAGSDDPSGIISPPAPSYAPARCVQRIDAGISVSRTIAPVNSEAQRAAAFLNSSKICLITPREGQWMLNGIRCLTDAEVIRRAQNHGWAP